MNIRLLTVLAFFILVSLAPVAHADGGVDLTAFPQQLADQLNIGLFPAQLLTTAIFLGLFLFPTLMLTRNVVAHLMIGLIIMGFCTAMNWLPYWIMLIVSMIAALMLSGKMRDWLSGSGARGD